MPSEFFCSRETVAAALAGKTVALVGSGPGCLDNDKRFIDNHDVVCRINNYKLGKPQGERTDIYYSFFGESIRKTVAELRADGVQLCMAKCPDAKPIKSEWHEANGKQAGIDFRPIYQRRQDWWFCPTYVPTVDEFMAHFNLLCRHVPTTGFSALLDVLSHGPASVYMTGFDGFTSKLHNVNEKWKPGDINDPIGHRPMAEAAWLKANVSKHPITVDRRLRHLLSRI